MELGHLGRHLELNELARISVGAIPGARSRDHHTRPGTSGRAGWSTAKVGVRALHTGCGDFVVNVDDNAVVLAMQTEVSQDIALQVCCKDVIGMLTCIARG